MFDRKAEAGAMFELLRKVFGPDELPDGIERNYGMQHVVADAPGALAARGSVSTYVPVSPA